MPPRSSKVENYEQDQEQIVQQEEIYMVQQVEIEKNWLQSLQEKEQYQSWIINALYLKKLYYELNKNFQEFDQTHIKKVYKVINDIHKQKLEFEKQISTSLLNLKKNRQEYTVQNIKKKFTFQKYGKKLGKLLIRQVELDTSQKSVTMFYTDDRKASKHLYSFPQSIYIQSNSEYKNLRDKKGVLDWPKELQQQQFRLVMKFAERKTQSGFYTDNLIEARSIYDHYYVHQSLTKQGNNQDMTQILQQILKVANKNYVFQQSKSMIKAISLFAASQDPKIKMKQSLKKYEQYFKLHDKYLMMGLHKRIKIFVQLKSKQNQAQQQKKIQILKQSQVLPQFNKHSLTITLHKWRLIAIQLENRTQISQTNELVINLLGLMIDQSQDFVKPILDVTLIASGVHTFERRINNNAGVWQKDEYYQLRLYGHINTINDNKQLTWTLSSEEDENSCIKSEIMLQNFEMTDEIQLKLSDSVEYFDGGKAQAKFPLSLFANQDRVARNLWLSLDAKKQKNDQNDDNQILVHIHGFMRSQASKLIKSYDDYIEDQLNSTGQVFDPIYDDKIQIPQFGPQDLPFIKHLMHLISNVRLSNNPQIALQQTQRQFSEYIVNESCKHNAKLRANLSSIIELEDHLIKINENGIDFNLGIFPINSLLSQHNWVHDAFSYDLLDKICQKGIPHYMRMTIWSGIGKINHLQNEYLTNLQKVGALQDDSQTSDIYKFLIENTQSIPMIVFQSLEDDFEPVQNRHFNQEFSIHQRNILNAFVLYDQLTNSKMNYNRAQITITERLLSLVLSDYAYSEDIYMNQMSKQEMAFWLLISIVSQILPRYFSQYDDDEIQFINNSPQKNMSKSRSARLIEEPHFPLRNCQLSDLKFDLMTLRFNFLISQGLIIFYMLFRSIHILQINIPIFKIIILFGSSYILIKNHKRYIKESLVIFIIDKLKNHQNIDYLNIKFYYRFTIQINFFISILKYQICQINYLFQDLYNHMLEMNISIEFLFSDCFLNLCADLFTDEALFHFWDYFYFEASKKNAKLNYLIIGIILTLLEFAQKSLLESNQIQDFIKILKTYGKIVFETEKFLARALLYQNTLDKQNLSEQYAPIIKDYESFYSKKSFQNVVMNQLVNGLEPFEQQKKLGPSQINQFIQKIQYHIKHESSENNEHDQSKTNSKSKLHQILAKRLHEDQIYLYLHNLKIQCQFRQELLMDIIYGQSKKQTPGFINKGMQKFTIKLTDDSKQKFTIELNSFKQINFIKDIHQIEFKIYYLEKSEQIILKQAVLNVQTLLLDFVHRLQVQFVDLNQSEDPQENINITLLDMSLVITSQNSKQQQPDSLKKKITFAPQKILDSLFKLQNQNDLKKLDLIKYHDLFVKNAQNIPFLHHVSNSSLIVPYNDWKMNSSIFYEEFKQVLKETNIFSPHIDVSLIFNSIIQSGQQRNFYLLEFIQLVIISHRSSYKLSLQLMFEALMLYETNNEQKVSLNSVKKLIGFICETLMIPLSQAQIDSSTELVLNQNTSSIIEATINSLDYKFSMDFTQHVRTLSIFAHQNLGTQDIHLGDSESLYNIQEYLQNKIDASQIHDLFQFGQAIVCIIYRCGSQILKKQCFIDKNWKTLNKSIHEQNVLQSKTASNILINNENTLNLKDWLTSINVNQFFQIMSKMPLINYYLSFETIQLNSVNQRDVVFMIEVKVESYLIITLNIEFDTWNYRPKNIQSESEKQFNNLLHQFRDIYKDLNNRQKNKLEFVSPTIVVKDFNIFRSFKQNLRHISSLVMKEAINQGGFRDISNLGLVDFQSPNYSFTCSNICSDIQNLSLQDLLQLDPNNFVATVNYKMGQIYDQTDQIFCENMLTQQFLKLNKQFNHFAQFNYEDQVTEYLPCQILNIYGPQYDFNGKILKYAFLSVIFQNFQQNIYLKRPEDFLFMSQVDLNEIPIGSLNLDPQFEQKMSQIEKIINSEYQIELLNFDDDPLSNKQSSRKKNLFTEKQEQTPKTTQFE